MSDALLALYTAVGVTLAAVIKLTPATRELECILDAGCSILINSLQGGF